MSSEEFRKPSLLRVLPLVIFIKVARWLGLGSYICHFLVTSRKIKERLGWRGYMPDRHDVIVAVHGKAGTNWMLQMTLHIANLGQKVEFEHIVRIVPWPGCAFWGVPPLDRSVANVQVPPTGLRVIKTHVDPVDIPYSIDAKYISVLRDPKEIVISGYHFWPPMWGLEDVETPRDWLEFVLRQQDQGFCCTLAKHMAHCWERRNTPNWLVLMYNDMKKDSRGTVERVAKHMGIALTPDQVDNVVEFSSFEYMKKIDDKFAPPEIPFLNTGKTVALVRQGGSGLSEKVLYDDQDLQQIDDFMLKELAKIKSDLPYRECFTKSGMTKSQKSE